MLERAAQVGADRHGLPARGLDGANGLPQAAREAPVGLDGSSGHHDVSAQAPELDGDLLADTAAGARHDRRLLLHVHRWPSLEMV